MTQNQMGSTKNGHNKRGAHTNMIRVVSSRRQDQGIGVGDATLRRLTDVPHIDGLT